MTAARERVSGIGGGAHRGEAGRADPGAAGVGAPEPGSGAGRAGAGFTYSRGSEARLASLGATRGA